VSYSPLEYKMRRTLKARPHCQWCDATESLSMPQGSLQRRGALEIKRRCNQSLLTEAVQKGWRLCHGWVWICPACLAKSKHNGG
jgi:hypothetical protein